MKYKVRPARFQTSRGKYVYIQRKRKAATYQMIEDNCQITDYGNCGKVTVYEVKEDNLKMAFCFEVENKSIFPIVIKADSGSRGEINFKVLEGEKKFTLDKTFFFQWGEKEVDDWKSLKSIAEPNTYLGINKGKVVTCSQCFPCFKLDKLENEEPKNLRGKPRRLLKRFAVKGELKTFRNISSTKGS
ncbi:uncharacterized protein LOC127628733 [Xyrauchen texanus]|uniref:uncharacterized protein LOC127628733 n=1 Tax=Xyrauchen texanus TaxID=154827 RepID=UPI002241D503|nr:uncharacterized protein LOC127628733 [Xyrauchen texanus]